MSFAATFSLDPSKFPYSKQTITQKRGHRTTLKDELFFDLVLTEVARIPNPTKLYPPKNIADLRHLHEAIESCPVDLLKKQCCIYYILCDWDTQSEYAKDQAIPQNYCNLMESYWFLDNQQYSNALQSLTVPGLTPNFATKIMATLMDSGNHEMLLTYVQTLQTPLDTEEKVNYYLKALMRVDVSRALFFTRTTTTTLRKSLFQAVLKYAKTTHENAKILIGFPFDGEEETWSYDLLSTAHGLGLEALVLRLLMLGKTKEALVLREKEGGGRHELTHAMKSHINEVELKVMQG